MRSGNSCCKRSMPSRVGDGGRHRQRRAAPKCLLPLPLPEPATITSLKAAACRTVRRWLAHWRTWHVLGNRTIYELCSGCAVSNRRDPSSLQIFLCLFATTWNVPTWMWQTAITAAGPLSEIVTMTTNADFACHFSRALLPYHAPGRNQSKQSAVFRGVTLCCGSCSPCLRPRFWAARCSIQRNCA